MLYEEITIPFIAECYVKKLRFKSFIYRENSLERLIGWVWTGCSAESVNFIE